MVMCDREPYEPLKWLMSGKGLNDLNGIAYTKRALFSVRSAYQYKRA